MKTPLDPDRWVIHGHAYSATIPATLRFCLNFLGRNWFGTTLKGAEAVAFTQLMLTIYLVQRQGFLLSKKDAMRAIGAEQVTTAKRYVDAAVELGMLRVEKSKRDRRVELLVPTQAGLQIIEKELKAVEETIHWAETRLAEQYEHEAHFSVREAPEPPRLKLSDNAPISYDFESAITVEPPRLEELLLVNDPFAGQGGPQTFTRYIEAYTETLRLMPENVYALEERARLYGRIGRHDKALADMNRLMELRPDQYLTDRARVYLEMDRYDEAIADVTRLMELKPELAPRALRAQAYARKGEWQGALEDFDAAIKEVEEMFKEPVVVPEVWAGRGTAHAALGHFDEALADLEKAYERVGYLHKSREENLQFLEQSSDYAELVKMWREIPDEFGSYAVQLKQVIDHVRKVKESQPAPTPERPKRATKKAKR
jgi:tetratricopeptide (TPR) repeat protein